MGKKYLHRLGFKITDEFLSGNNFKKYCCGDELIPIITLIKAYANEVLQKEWMADSVLKLPYSVNATNPASLLLKEDGYENGFVEFYCHESLSKVELDRIVYNLKSSIEEFIERHRKGLEEYDSKVNLDDITINFQSEAIVDTKFLSENLSLVKVLFLRKLSNKLIFIGTGEDDKYLLEGREVKFFPSYSRQAGHMLISEIIDINVSNRIEKMAYYITPNVEVYDGEIYLYPLIGVKRLVSYKRLNSIQYGTAESYSTLVFDGSAYYSPRIAYRQGKESDIKELQVVYQDWRLYKYLEEFRGITFKEIKKHIEGADEPNIYLVYSNKLGNKHKLGSGVPSCDKLDIFNYIKTNIDGLESIEPIEELKIKNRLGGGLTNTDKIALSNTMFRNNRTEIELLVIQPTSSTLYQNTIDVIESGKLIEDNVDLTIFKRGVYFFKIGNKENIQLLVRHVPSVAGLEIKSEGETLKERLSKLLNDIGEISPTRITLALIDLENMGKYDAKLIIRNALDSYGIINQFIDSKTGINTNKIASGLRDLLNDIGLGNLNQSIGQNEVIYTLHKTSKINFICRLCNDTVEIKIPCVTDSYCYISDIYKVLPFVKDIVKDLDDMDSLAIGTFLKDIKEENRDVIVILENGETQYNTILGSLNDENIKEIKLYTKEYITTDLLGHQEVIQISENKPTLGTGIYKINENTYISIGDKGQDKTSIEASKIRTWTNKHDKMSIGATISYKDRVAYEIRIHNHKQKCADDICELIHKLRLSLTTHSHLNRCMSTDYILGLDKHL